MPPGKPAKDDYFSKITCDCGCENLMPQKLVDLGWKYLRGHKPHGTLITKPRRFGSTKTLHLQSQSTDFDAMLKFANTQWELLFNQQVDLTEQRDKANKALDEIGPKVEKWGSVLDSLKELK